MDNKGWIGVDLDGTLAHHEEFSGLDTIGAPIPLMVRRVKRWLVEGRDVRIFTARISGPGWYEALLPIQAWCEEHIGQRLPVTCSKDFAMIELWDDRVVQVEANTGKVMGDGSRRGLGP